MVCPSLVLNIINPKPDEDAADHKPDAKLASKALTRLVEVKGYSAEQAKGLTDILKDKTSEEKLSKAFGKRNDVDKLVKKGLSKADKKAYDAPKDELDSNNVMER